MLIGIAVAVVAVACDVIVKEAIVSDAYLTTNEVAGTSKNCAVVLRAEQGTSYSATLTSENDWAHFSNGDTVLSDTMTTTDKVIYIYFDTNPSGVERSATVRVEFSDGESFRGEFTQLSYDATIAVDRRWAELPVCRTDDDYIYNTYYGQLGVNSHARNFTYCFDPSVRASLWVAYPLHSAYTTGSANRNNSSFRYDPLVSISDQANMAAGSYNGPYDRGHQIAAADRKCSQEMMDQTFYATNMTPQYYNFNQNKWGSLEGKVRNQICSDTLYVVTGAYFGGEHHSSIESSTTDRSGNRCPTPTHYFKALLRTSKGNSGYAIDQVRDAKQLRAIAFWMEHANTGNSTAISASECISIAELEELTGIEFFPMIDDSIEDEVKSSAIPSLWGVNL